MTAVQGIAEDERACASLWKRWGVLVLLFAVLGSWSAVHAQEETALDTLEVGERVDQLVGSLSGSQAGYRNWAEGGISTLTFTANLRGKSVGVGQDWKQRHEARLGFGVVRTEEEGYRKSVDIIRAASTLLYRSTGFWQTFKPTLAVEGRTQFAAGYNYRENPFDDGRDLPVRVSGFLSPAYFSEIAGLTYERGEWFSQRLGAGVQQTVVVDEQLRPLYGVRSNRAALVEAGLESQTELDRLVLPRTRFKSSLSLFKSFRQWTLPDMYWENLLEIQANQWLSTNVSVVLLYDEDISTDLQLKEVISVGLTVAFI